MGFTAVKEALRKQGEQMALRKGYEVEVGSLPKCDVCGSKGVAKTAEYDASVPAFNGTWANLCGPCFSKFGCRLGIGAGQHLVLRQN